MFFMKYMFDAADLDLDVYKEHSGQQRAENAHLTQPFQFTALNVKIKMITFKFSRSKSG